MMNAGDKFIVSFVMYSVEENQLNAVTTVILYIISCILLYRHSLRYKLIETLNNTSETITEMAISQSQKKIIAYIKNDMIATYRDCCDIPNCYICSDT